ncbi:hypothetical protein PMAYCL1PPCAC_17112, partial [Pristionchus mayeri]
LLQMRLLLFLLAILGSIAAQAITPNALLCSTMQMSTAPAAVKTKYKTLLTNLIKDTTLAAQQTRVKNWLNNNYVAAGIPKANLDYVLPNTASKIASRWRIVVYCKGLLAKIKPNLGATKFEEIRKLLWKLDKDSNNIPMFSYDDWKTKAVAAISDATKKATVKNIIADWELADGKKSPDNFNNDGFAWMAPPGFNGCSIV